MDFKQKQRLIGQKTDWQVPQHQWWDMNNYVDSGFTLQNVRQKMFEIDGDLISREEQSRRTVQELQQYQDPQAAELEELKRKRIEKQNEELEKEYRERYDGFTGTLKYFWDGLVQAPRGYQILKEAKVIDYVEEKAQDGVDEVIDKIVDNPVTNTISGVYNFLKSLIQNRYLYLLGFIFIIILIKKV